MNEKRSKLVGNYYILGIVLIVFAVVVGHSIETHDKKLWTVQMNRRQALSLPSNLPEAKAGYRLKPFRELLGGASSEAITNK